MFYPIFIDFKGKEVVVFGGGQIGTRRANTLQESGARVTVVAKEFSQELKDSTIELVTADLKKETIDLTRYYLVVLATDDEALNSKLAERAFESGILVNRADQGTAGDVIFPMVSKVKGHTLAYTTLGDDPKLLKRIKEKIEDEFS